MQRKLTIRVEEKVIVRAKAWAKRRGVSLSDALESVLESLPAERDGGAQLSEWTAPSARRRCPRYWSRAERPGRARRPPPPRRRTPPVSRRVLYDTNSLLDVVLASRRTLVPPPLPRPRGHRRCRGSSVPRLRRHHDRVPDRARARPLQGQGRPDAAPEPDPRRPDDGRCRAAGARDGPRRLRGCGDRRVGAGGRLRVDRHSQPSALPGGDREGDPAGGAFGRPGE